jgi:hypothetical protein
LEVVGVADQWPDVAVLERPGPGLPLEAVDPSIAETDPLSLDVYSDRLQAYVRRAVVVPPADEVAAVLVRVRAERRMAGLRASVRAEAEALHAWLTARIEGLR